MHTYLIIGLLPIIIQGTQIVPECIKQYPGQAITGAPEYKRIPVPTDQDCLQNCLSDGPRCQGVVHTRYPDGSHTCTLYSENSQHPGCSIVTPQSIQGEIYSLYEIPSGCTNSPNNLAPKFLLHGAPSVPHQPIGGFPSAIVPVHNRQYGPVNTAPWGPCSVTCGNGIQVRRMDCFNCPGPLREQKNCFLGPCANWVGWGEWSPCSVSCGSGTTTRNRACSHGFGQCGGQAYQRQSCNLPSCSRWSQWQDWSGCSVTCGSGTTSRTRRCEGGNPNGCQGSSLDQRSCSSVPCPTWTQWTQWSQCTRTCNGGTKFRGRTCQSIGLCHGSSREEVQCNGQGCPQWTLWSPWSSCSATCNGGQRSRSRTCSFGYGCFGVPNESQRCNTHQCPTWANWNPWSPCSQTCGNGIKTRSRSCFGGGFCQGGSGTQTTICNKGPCATWQQWGPWNDCSVTCGVGVRQRIRGCTRGASCPRSSESDQESCQLPVCQQRPISTFNPQPPQIFFPASTGCQYQPWGRWTQCSRTCGTGFESRNRYCPCDSCGTYGDPLETRPCTDRPGLVQPPCPGFYNPRYRPFYIERNIGRQRKNKT